MLNIAQVLGRVGKIETTTAASGIRITKCSIVTSKKFLKNGQKEEKITWHNVTIFNKLAEVAEKYVNVGDLLYIQGEMDTQKYTTKEGQERVNYVIIANELKLMPKTKEHAVAPKGTPYNPGVVDDDVPW